MPLVGAPACESFQELDILDVLSAGTAEPTHVGFDAPPCDLVACFGFLHHVPGWGNRVRLLRELGGHVAPGGFLVVSFWQFMNSPALAVKACESHARGLQALAERGLDAAALEQGDYLLGWQDRQDVFRYCHSFTQDEVRALADEAGLAEHIVDSFEADGRTGNLNAYLVVSGA